MTAERNSICLAWGRGGMGREHLGRQRLGEALHNLADISGWVEFLGGRRGRWFG